MLIPKNKIPKRVISDLPDAFGNKRKKARIRLPSKRPDPEVIPDIMEDVVKTPTKGKKVQADIHREKTPTKVLSAPCSPTKIRRSLVTTEPINPHSVENILTGEINAILLQTISLTDKSDTNQLVRENFQVVRSKLDALLMKSISTHGLNLMEFKAILDEIPINTHTRVLLNTFWSDHIDGLQLLPECKCLSLIEEGGKKFKIHSKISREIFPVKT